MRRRQGDIRRRWELRVLVALPAVWILFAAVEGYLAIEMTRDALGFGGRAAFPRLDGVILTVIGVSSLLALACGVALALAVTRPMRDLLRKIQHRLQGDAAVGLTSGNELRQLSNAFDHMLLSFEKFVSDTHIVDGMPLGILVIDRDDMIVRANGEALRLLPSPDAVDGARRLGQASRLHDVCPEGMYPPLAEALTSVRDTGLPMQVGPELLLGPEPDAVESTRRVDLYPTTSVGEVVIVIRDLKHLANIRGQMQRVDQLAALGAHMASLAHEIGGGLMGIQMLIEALEPRTPADVKLLDKLRAECERAARLLTEIRTFGQASARERVAVNLGRLVEEILWMLEPRLMTKHITVEKHLDLELAPVLIDRDRIVQAILNIVNNAFEATPLNGRVTIAVARSGERTVVKIANTGSFIPPEEQAKIFTLFYTTRPGGSGFGLPQARRALVDHGGDIEVTSSRERGTEFVLQFPDAPVPTSLPPAEATARQTRSVSEIAR
jgi:signal transduction histidine kinase